MSHAVLVCAVCKHACVQASGALGVTGLADCCIIFGRAAPSLWRASLKSPGSLCLPLSGSGSSAKQVRWLLQPHSPLEPWPVHSPGHPALCYTQMARLLIGSRALHFHWCSASGSGYPTPSLKTDTQMQPCSCVYTGSQCCGRCDVAQADNRRLHPHCISKQQKILIPE